MIILKSKGTFNFDGKIVLDSMKAIHWKDLSDKNPPHLPNGFSIDVSITVNENNFLSGKDGIVWATYDSRQAEIIQSTLLAQHINCETKRIILEPEPELDYELDHELDHELELEPDPAPAPKLKNLYLISVTNEREIKMAIDFIWKSDSGLRLKPDWSYPTGKTNKSFELWLSGR